MMVCVAILPGAPICEYVGVLPRTGEKRSGSDMHMPSLHVENNSEAPPAPEYCIDAGSVGSFARFINHGCNPNLFAQCVLTNHHDIKLEKVMLVAADMVAPNIDNCDVMNSLAIAEYVAEITTSTDRPRS
ncbi:histone-lysine N-methyltransferase, H3 lysine-9 specific SUVH4 [Triticum aestivum]|uniref:histone-lysine N-methyltransferase, H3 lysine-9 specific SUVH4 n=1 Tax=Triticum aestivum TaxID=4565 RepID=UPI001D0226FB|nr:histone-lysine N-methyltransferase, H3 lysine-9 specific SUVH4-like [Triticum aestivum]